MRRTNRHPRWLALLAAACVVVAVTACGGGGGGGNVLKWYVFDEPSGAFADAAKDCTEKSKGKYEIELAVLPTNADEQREQIARRLAAEDPDLDIIAMDVIWTAEFAQAGWILPFEGAAAEAATAGRLEPTVKSATYDDTLYGAPFTSNTQLLWYRTDLTDKPPTTWEQVLEQSDALAQEGKPSLVQVQGQRYEGLVVWFTSLVESAGGTILNKDGTKVSLEEGPTRKALEVMKRLSTSDAAAPPNLSTAREDDGRLAFESGESAFMVNYTFVWPSAQAAGGDLAANMRWARYPGIDADTPSKVSIGGFNLGIGAYSKKADLARDAATCIANEEHQLDAALRGGLLPSSESVYESKELTEAPLKGEDGKPIVVDGKEAKAFPYLDEVRATLADAVQRPQTPYYNDVALAIARTIHPTKSIDPEGDVQRLRDAIERALEGKGLL